MWTGIDFLLVLQDLRLSLPDFVTDFFNILARQEFQYFIPILLGAVFLWCFGKREGEFLLFNFTFSNLVGYLAKNIAKVPRPWDIDPDIQPTAESKKGAPGYSLPSGHTTSSVSGYGTAAYLSKNTILRILFIVMAVLIPFSRMYLGVHTPMDLIVAIIIVAAVCFVNYKILAWSHESVRNRMYVLVGYLIVAIALSVACDLTAGKFLSNKMAGLSVAIPLCLLIEERFVGYEVPSASLKDRLTIAIPGLIVAFVLMEILVRIHTYGVIASTSAAAVFIILVYPYLLKRYSGRSA